MSIDDMTLDQLRAHDRALDERWHHCLDPDGSEGFEIMAESTKARKRIAYMEGGAA